MGRRTITATLAVGLTAALISPPAQAVPGAAHIGVAAQAVPAAPLVLAAAKKKAKGTVQVELTGAGSYTVTGKGFRKSAQSSKSFKVAAGAYKVSAPGASVSPGSVKVKPGKKVTVTVAFPVAPVVTPPPVVSPPVQTSPPPDPTTPPPPPVDTTPPGRVSGLAVGTRTPSSIGLSWTNPGDADLAEIIVRRAQGNTAPATPSAGTAVTLGSAKASSVTDTGLAAGTQYSYAVFTRDGTGNTNTNGVTVTASTTSPPDVTPPGQVSGLTVGARTQSSIALSWTNPGDADLAEIVVRRAQGGTAPASPTAGTAVTLGSAKASSVTDTGLSADTQYSYAVFTRDGTGNTNPTAVTVTTSTMPTPDTTPPPVPDGLTVEPDDSQALLSWNAVTAADLREYVVYQATAKTGPWTPAAGSPVTGTGLTVTGLDNGTTYWFAVASRDTTGNTSDRSTSNSGTPVRDTTPPGKVTDLAVTARGDSFIHLSWTNPTDRDLASVIVRRTKGATPPAGPTDGQAVTLASPTATTVEDTGLDKTTRYSYAVFTRDRKDNTNATASTLTARTRDSNDSVCAQPLTEDTTWSPDYRDVYVINCQFTVPQGVTLAIEPGTVLKFGTSNSLDVDPQGTLVAEGTERSPIVFTSITDDSVGGDTNGDSDQTSPRPGEWSGIRVDGLGSSVALDFAQVRWAGLDFFGDQPVSVRHSSFTGGTGINVVSSAAVVVADNVVAEPNVDRPPSYVFGVRAEQTGTGSTQVVRNTITGVAGARYGVFVTADRGEAPAPTVMDNTVRDADAEAVMVSAAHLLPDRLTGNTGTDNAMNVMALSGTLDADLTLPAAGLQIVPANFGQHPGLTVASGVTLTVRPGTVVKADYRDGDPAGIVVHGTLVAEGIEQSPIVFTSITDDSVGGDTNGDGGQTTPYTGGWFGIRVDGQGSSVSMDWAKVRWAGLDYSGDQPVSVCHSRFTDSTGIIVGSSAAVVVADNVVAGPVAANAPNSGVFGIHVYQTGAATAEVVRNTVTGAGGDRTARYGVFVTAESGDRGDPPAPMVMDNTVRDAGMEAVVVSAAHLLPDRLTGNTGSDNAMNVMALSGTLDADLTLPAAGLQIVPANFGQHPGLTVASGVTLTARPGTVVKADYRDGEPASIVVHGSLVAEGTEQSPIVFTSITDDSVGGDTNGDGGQTFPHTGDWDGLLAEGSVSMVFARVRWAGLDCFGDQPVSVRHSVFTDGTGIVAGSSAGVVVADNTVTGPDPAKGYWFSGIQVYQTGVATTEVVGNTVTGVGGDRTSGAGHGVFVSATRGDLGEPPAPTVMDNTVRDAGAEAVVVFAVHLLPDRLTGNTGTDNTMNVMALAGTLDGDLTLPAAGLQIVPANSGTGWTSAGLQVAAGVTLTVLPGAVVKTEDWPQTAGIVVYGTLLAEGTEQSPIVFTSITDDSVGGDTNGDGGQTTPQTGDWSGIVAGSGSVVRLDHAVLSYAGTALSVDAGDADVSFHGVVSHDQVGVWSMWYVDATNVDWGSPTGPSPIGSGIPVEGDGVVVVPWVGYIAPPVNPGTQEPPVTHPACPDYEFIGARGSGENPQNGKYDEEYEPNNMGDEIKLVYSVFYNQMIATTRPGDTPPDIKPVGMRYPAWKAPSGAFAWLFLGTQDFDDSYLDGKAWLQKQITSFHRDCPAKHIVLAGYSQGALAIHLALRGLSTAEKDQISAIVLLADAAKTGDGKEWVLGSATNTAPGLYNNFWRAKTEMPDELGSRTVSYCNAFDMVCAPGLGSNPAPHLMYNGDELTMLGNWAANQIQPKAK